MAFSFGSPAPAPGAFSYASSNNPAPGGAFSFGSASPAAPAPAGGGFAFGGNAAAPAAGGFGFGSTTAASAPAPNTGFSFASSAPAPAPSNTGLFSFTSPVPAPATSPFSFTGAPTAPQFPQSPYQQQQQPQPQQPVIAGNMPYSALPPQYKSAIDDLYNKIRKHQRTMEHVKSMAPHQLVVSPSLQEHSHHGYHHSHHLHSKINQHPQPALTIEREQLRDDLAALEQHMLNTISKIQALQIKSEELNQQVRLYAKWPLEAVAIRRGVRLPVLEEEEKKDESSTGTSASTTSAMMAQRVQQLLDSQLAYVDRVESMPSVYLLKALQEWQQRVHDLETKANQQLLQLQQQQQQLSTYDSSSSVPLEYLISVQHQVMLQTAMRIAQIQKDMDEIRNRYYAFERGENVLDKADQEEFEEEQRWTEQVLLKYVEHDKTKHLASQNPHQPAAAWTTAPSTTAPARSTFSFTPASSATTTAAASIPTTTGFPGTTTTAPAPLFGPTTTATAPAATTPAFSFNSTPSSSKKKSSSSSSRSSARLRR